MEGMPDLMTCGFFCFGGVVSLFIVLFVTVTRNASAPPANGKGRESFSSMKTTEKHTSPQLQAGEPRGDKRRSADYRDAATSTSIARPFACCGPLSASVPVLGAITLALFFHYSEESFAFKYLIGGNFGPTRLIDISQSIMGCAGLVGFILGCMALARRERYRGWAVLGLLACGPLMFLLLARVSDWTQ
jgi:hypothetical protein